MPTPADRYPRISLSSDTIRLGQFLKLAALAESGAQARDLITDGEVLVNGVPEQRRGRQLTSGDVVEVDQPSGRHGAVVG